MKWNMWNQHPDPTRLRLILLHPVDEFAHVFDDFPMIFCDSWLPAEGFHFSHDLKLTPSHPQHHRSTQKRRSETWRHGLHHQQCGNQLGLPATESGWDFRILWCLCEGEQGHRCHALKMWYCLVVWNMHFVVPYIGNHSSNWLILFRGVLSTTNQCGLLMVFGWTSWSKATGDGFFCWRHDEKEGGMACYPNYLENLRRWIIRIGGVGPHHPLWRSNIFIQKYPCYDYRIYTYLYVLSYYLVYARLP